jgi:hypothetical protein
MDSRIARYLASFALIVTGVVVSAQIQLPNAPAQLYGASISPAYEGWFDNPDGTHSFLIGYYSRNTEAEVDVPIGPNNKFSPGDIDLGQPTHFLTRRRFGMFTVTVPKEFPKTQKITWTLTANGVTTSIPFYMNTDYNVTPLRGSEESPDGTFDLPPTLRFEEAGPSFNGPSVTTSKALTRTATAKVPMPLEIWADDDARFSGGGTGPQGAVVSVVISKYRGPGTITVVGTTPPPAAARGAEPAAGGGRGGGRGGGGANRINFETLKGGKPMQPYSGKASTTVTFSEPGDYILHVTLNDYSGNGGGGSGCCWTNAMIKVNVGGASTTNGN